MKEYISIKNLGPIDHIDQMEVAPFTVLIGNSASGKSTLMKVIALMRYIYKLANIRSYLRLSRITKSPFRSKFPKWIKENGLAVYFSDTTEIKYEVQIEDHTYIVQYLNGKLSQLPEIAKNDLTFEKGSFISENRNMIPTWASRVASNKGATLGYYFHETYKDFDRATEDVPSLLLSHLNMKMGVEKKGNKKKFLIYDSARFNRPLELHYASSGIQTSAPLLMIVEYLSSVFSFKDAFRRSVLSYLFDNDDRLSKYHPSLDFTDWKKCVHIHVEEPELSLYPSAQSLLIDQMVKSAFQKVSDERQVGIIMATHSPYIFNHINVLLLRPKTDPHILPDQLAAYRIINGTIQNRKLQDNKGNWFILTDDLSEEMESINNECVKLSEL